MFFVLQNFVKPYQSSKAPSSCLGQIFVKRQNRPILPFVEVNLSQNVSQVNLISLLLNNSHLEITDARAETKSNWKEHYLVNNRCTNGDTTIEKPKPMKVMALVYHGKRK